MEEREYGKISGLVSNHMDRTCLEGRHDPNYTPRLWRKESMKSYQALFSTIWIARALEGRHDPNYTPRLWRKESMKSYQA
jgi:hypothetical protein